MQTTPENLDRHEQIGASEFALFALILTVAMVARIANLSWGLPDVFEEASPFEMARKFWGGPGGGISLAPDSFHYPALSFYIHFFIQAIHFLTGLLSGQFGSLDEFRAAMASNPGDFMLSSRIVSVLFDLGTVGLVWMTAREVFGRWTAVGASLMAALSPLLIAGAHSVNVDVILTFFLMMVLRHSLKLSGHAGAGEFLLTGVMVGLAASTKYSGALFLALPAFMVAADFAFGSSRTLRFLFREIGLALLIPISAAAVFAALNPGILFDQGGFLRDFTYERFYVAPGQPALGAGRSSVEFYLAGTIGAKLGVLFLGGAAAGIIASFTGRNPGGVAIAAMAVIYITVISTWEMRAERYLLPAVPLLSILCTAGTIRALTWAAERSTESPRVSILRPFVTRALPPAALLAVLVVPTLESVRYHLDISRDDTRTAAREWIAANIPQGSVVAAGSYGIAFPRERYTVVYIPSAEAGSDEAAPFHDARWYEDLDLLVAADFDRGRHGWEQDKFGRMMKVYGNLRLGWRLAAELEPGEEMRGPTIWLFAPDTSERPEAFDRTMLDRLASVNDPERVVRFVKDLSKPLLLRGQTEKARQLMEVGIGLSPADDGLLRSMTYLLYKQERYSEALGYVARAIGAGGASTDLLALKAEIMIGMGDPDGAEKVLLRAIEEDPGATLPYPILIRIYSGKGDTGRLMTTLKRYLSMIPGGSNESEKIRTWLDSLRVNG